MVLRRHAKKDLIRTMWPDKLLYGSILLVLTASIGLLHALVSRALGITYSRSLPEYLHPWPMEVTALFSAIAAGAAVVSLKRLSTAWGIGGAVAGALSMGLLGLGAFLSLVAGGFLVLARLEGEDQIPADKRLDPADWPDKSLAASLVLLLAGLLSAVWSGALLTDTLAFGGGRVVFGGLAAGAALAALAAAYLLYHQRGLWVGVVAVGLNVLAVAGYVLGPLLAIAALVLLLQARGEGEFEEAAEAAPAAAPTP